MKALRLADCPKDKKSLDGKCKELLTRAEKIKESRDAYRAGDKAQRRLSPASTRKLTNREEIILLEGAKLHGFIFPPWTYPPDADEFESKNEEELFTYVTVLALSLHIFVSVHTLTGPEMSPISVSPMCRERSLLAGSGRVSCCPVVKETTQFFP